jgi:hypothetical protein
LFDSSVHCVFCPIEEPRGPRGTPRNPEGPRGPCFGRTRNLNVASLKAKFLRLAKQTIFRDDDSIMFLFFSCVFTANLDPFRFRRFLLLLLLLLLIVAFFFRRLTTTIRCPFVASAVPGSLFPSLKWRRKKGKCYNMQVYICDGRFTLSECSHICYVKGSITRCVFNVRFHVRQTVCRRGWPTNVACLCVKRFVGHRNAHQKRTVYSTLKSTRQCKRDLHSFTFTLSKLF